jgi:hypothetical protein
MYTSHLGESFDVSIANLIPFNDDEIWHIVVVRGHRTGHFMLSLGTCVDSSVVP